MELGEHHDAGLAEQGPAAAGTGLRRSGDQDGLARQSPGSGLVVDGRRVGQRAPLSHLDLQISGVEAGDQLGELGGVAVRIPGGSTDQRKCQRLYPEISPERDRNFH